MLFTQLLKWDCICCLIHFDFYLIFHLYFNCVFMNIYLDLWQQSITVFIKMCFFSILNNKNLLLLLLNLTTHISPQHRYSHNIKHSPNCIEPAKFIYWHVPMDFKYSRNVTTIWTKFNVQVTKFLIQVFTLSNPIQVLNSLE